MRGGGGCRQLAREVSLPTQLQSGVGGSRAGPDLPLWGVWALKRHCAPGKGTCGLGLVSLKGWGVPGDHAHQGLLTQSE